MKNKDYYVYVHKRNDTSVVKYGDDLAKAILATWKLYMLTSEEYSGYSDRHANVELLHKYIDEVRLWQ